MRDTASDPLALYMFGRTLSMLPYSYNQSMFRADLVTQAENPKFMGSLKRYYMDTIAYQGAMQFFPRFLEGYSSLLSTDVERYNGKADSL